MPERFFQIQIQEEQTPLDQLIEQGLAQPISPLTNLPALTNVVQGDPFLAEQLATLRQQFELRPVAAAGLISRIRTRLAWWLLGPELQQTTEVHATLLRIIDSMIVLVDQERAARRRIEEQLADLQRTHI